MSTHPGKRRMLMLTATLAGLVLTGCASGTTTSMGPGDNDGGPGMMGNGSRYHYAPTTCPTPSSLPGTTVRVTLGDMGMTKMMGGIAPMGAHMRLRASAVNIPAGKVSLLVSNLGWRTHELVVLPLGNGIAAGRRIVGSNGRVSEAGSLGEASRSCGAGSGEGITSGSAGWTTLTLAPGRYELVCNLRNHYADGMRQALDVS